MRYGAFNFHVKGQVESLLLILRTGSLMAVDFKQSEVLRTYEGVVKLLLRTFATDDVTAKVYSDVFSFRQSPAMTEEACSGMLLDNAICCEPYFPTDG